MDAFAALLLTFLAIAGFLALVPLSIMFNAYILHQMWAWFIVPLGAAPIGLAHAWGLAILVAMFTTKDHRIEGTNKQKIARGLGLFMAPFFTLLFGYIAHSFM